MSYHDFRQDRVIKTEAGENSSYIAPTLRCHVKQTQLRFIVDVTLLCIEMLLLSLSLALVNATGARFCRRYYHVTLQPDAATADGVSIGLAPSLAHHTV